MPKRDHDPLEKSLSLDVHSKDDSDNEQDDTQAQIEKTTSRISTKHKHTLTKIITARSNATTIDPGPPPDGGVKAWIQALMGHLVVFNTWGLISSFGVFQTHYTSTLGMNPSAVSWIGSIQMAGHFFLGMLSGRALDAGLFRWVMVPGVVLAALGMFVTSLCGEYWQFLLAQGVLTGVGCGLQFTPAMSLVTTYFHRNRSLAVAIVASGSATGGLVYPTLARQLLPRIGLAWTIRTMAFIMLGVGACYTALLRPRLPPRKSGPLLEVAAFREPAYALYCAGIFFVAWGSYFAFYYIGAYGVEVVHVDYGTSVNVLMIMNGVGLLGRLVPSYFADRCFGAYNVLIPFSIFSGVVLFFWALVRTPGGLYGFAVVYGLASAGYQGLFPSTLSSLTKDMRKVGVRNGMGFAVVGFSNLTGPPIAGAIVQRSGGYLAAQMWGATMILVGSSILVFGRISITGKKWRVKV
ncbi:MFS general substrate transporter [Polyplosphaeria fusca]|uniref:MFS general substrate transporter n=1 Tax=Polyplosphaeria fusca TaxID=682080 RepID=A0A9P4V2Z1_9PLEO|nr:MFS general substrate transporter [Polyplosphaeria fusca]